jgi:Flp pilus assembly pilin Flp
LKNLIAKLHNAIINLKSEEGQDTIETALFIALIAFGCTAGIGHLATSIHTAFSKLAHP